MKPVNEEYYFTIRHIMERGKWIRGRNGRTLSIPIYTFGIPVKKLEDTMLTSRKMYFKGIEGEFKTLMDRTPLTNVEQFEANGCNYWRKWAGPNGELNLDYHNKLHPAYENMIDNIVRDPLSRRHLISLWDNTNVDTGILSLPCCWYGLQFILTPNEKHGYFEMSLLWIQRSVDVGLGLPSDIYLSGMFMFDAIDKLKNRGLNVVPLEIYYSLANVHIYEEHYSELQKITTSENKELKLNLKLKE